MDPFFDPKIPIFGPLLVKSGVKMGSIFEPVPPDPLLLSCGFCQKPVKKGVKNRAPSEPK